MNILGNKVILRNIEPEDLEAIRSMTNDPEQEKMIVGWSFPTAKKHQEDWYQRILSDRNNMRFTIEYDNKFSGLIILSNIDWKNRSAETGIRLALDAPRNIGLGTDSLSALVRFAFEELGMNRLNTTILNYNEASLKLHAKCGFIQEGIKKQSVYKGGRFHDEILVAILRSDYYQKK